MLSIKDGKPISIIRGGERNGQIIYVKDSSTDSLVGDKLAEMKSNLEIMTLLKRGLYDRFNVKKQKEVELLTKAVKRGVEPLEEDLVDLYRKARRLLEESSAKEITIEDGVMQHIPDPEKRSVLYVAAPSGAGKSTYMHKYAQEYAKMFPERPIYLISRLREDETLDDGTVSYQRVDYSDWANPDSRPEPADFADSLVIFDDCDTIQDKEISKAVISVRDDLLETGRHSNTEVVITSHVINNYQQTRRILNEMTSLTIFMQGSSYHQVSYALRNYFGISAKEVDKLRNLPSRWVTVFKNYPQCVLYERGAFIIGGNGKK